MLISRGNPSIKLIWNPLEHDKHMYDITYRPMDNKLTIIGVIIITLYSRALPNCFKFLHEVRLDMMLEFMEGSEPNFESFFDDSSIWMSPGTVCHTVSDETVPAATMPSTLGPSNFKGVDVTLINAKCLVTKHTGWEN